MQTEFAPAQLADPETAASDKIIRKCVHCGFCTATCPTYLLLGDELDSPRGRIYLMKGMLERGGEPTPSEVKHVDRCLSCLSCMTTCPSGVHYMHLVDHARAHIEANYRRPWHERLTRAFLGALIPKPALFRAALRMAPLGRAFRPLLPGKLKGMVEMAPGRLPAAGAAERPGVFPAEGPRRARVALLVGCAQAVLGPQINEAAIRLLNRLGVEVVTARGAGCCGAVVHHLGKADASHDLAKANIAAWSAELDAEGLDAVVITASGCGTSVKDYGWMFRDDAEWGERAGRISALACDVSEFLQRFEPPPLTVQPLKVAYQAACSLQHGQQIKEAPKALLKAYGYAVAEPVEPHICCGSAGTYNLLQPQIAGQLRDRKAGNLNALQADVVASGNIGCMTQLDGALKAPVVHTVELLDWASGGPKPAALQRA
jgi:glycolate oxidase iron-sulfur subunit